MVEWSHPIQKMHSLKFTNTLIFSRITNLKYSKLTNEDAKEKGVSDGERYRKKERKKERKNVGSVALQVEKRQT